MRIYSKIAVALVTLAVSLPLAFGQNDATAPPPPTQSQAGPNQQFQHHEMQRHWMQHRGAWNRHNRRRMHRRHEFMLARLVNNPTIRERVGITPEQAEKIRTETFDFRKMEIRNRADIQVKHLELRELLSATTPDRNAIDSKLTEISAARLAEAKAAVNFRLDMRAALTPDQKQKLQQMREEFFHRRFGPNAAGGMEAGPHSGQ
ncbi:MAG: Spy/CpxP family protein refolding chaperone [Acidobacteriaceae bacterium]